jgi:hypothetical protein
MDQNERTLTSSLQRALTLLPNVSTILLDGQVDINPVELIGPRITVLRLNYLRIFSIADCSCRLSNTLFDASHFETLTYLDISNLPGSITSLLQPRSLPALQILKVRGRELDDSALIALITKFGLQLWSLDVSMNKISDEAIQSLREGCLPASQLRNDEHMQVEGTIIVRDGGSPDNGPFLSIQESDFSASFHHPERYFVDAPAYTAHVDMPMQSSQAVRLDGSAQVRRDSVDAVKHTVWEHDDHIGAEHYQYSTGATHLRLSHNRMSANGLQKLLRISNGHIKDLACDSMPLLPKGGSYQKAWPAHASLTGILGAAHCFRPVFSSNLRVLRIHHSLVTNIPTLQVKEFASLARVFIAETALFQRVEKAYPQTFVPDMNPRLISLTLTCLPRRSSGPLASRLLSFLKLLSVQERGIQDASMFASTRRGPGILQGLRHLRLEFEPDSMEDGFSASEDLNPEELMNSGEKVFSFFEDKPDEAGQWSAGSRADAKLAINSKGVVEHRPLVAEDQALGSDRDTSEFITYDSTWNGEPFSVQVWTGPHDVDAPDVLKAYRRLVLNNRVRECVGPATPAQVLAGAPPLSFIFQTAWAAAVMPLELKPPTLSELAGMGDVLDALRKYRLDGRASYTRCKELAQRDGHPILLGEPHYFWTGRLEVSTEPAMSIAQPSQYWR